MKLSFIKSTFCFLVLCNLFLLGTYFYTWSKLESYSSLFELENIEGLSFESKRIEKKRSLINSYKNIKFKFENTNFFIDSLSIVYNPFSLVWNKSINVYVGKMIVNQQNRMSLQAILKKKLNSEIKINIYVRSFSMNLNSGELKLFNTKVRDLFNSDEVPIQTELFLKNHNKKFGKLEISALFKNEKYLKNQNDFLVGYFTYYSESGQFSFLNKKRFTFSGLARNYLELNVERKSLKENIKFRFKHQGGIFLLNDIDVSGYKLDRKRIDLRKISSCDFEKLNINGFLSITLNTNLVTPKVKMFNECGKISIEKDETKYIWSVIENKEKGKKIQLYSKNFDLNSVFYSRFILNDKKMLTHETYRELKNYIKNLVEKPYSRRLKKQKIEIEMKEIDLSMKVKLFSSQEGLTLKSLNFNSEDFSIKSDFSKDEENIEFSAIDSSFYHKYFEISELKKFTINNLRAKFENEKSFALESEFAEFYAPSQIEGGISKSAYVVVNELKYFKDSKKEFDLKFNYKEKEYTFKEGRYEVSN